MKSVFVALIIYSLAALASHAKTVISGVITEDATWGPAGSPYEVGNTTVTANVTLTIQPGTVVQFHDFATMTVQGRIVANGTASQKITFTSLSGVQEGWAWRAIRTTNADGNGNGLGASSFSHCIFEGGGDWYNCMLEVWGGADVTIDQCAFRNSVTDGIRFYENSGGPISNTSFQNSAGYGLWLRASSPAVNGSTFAGNGNIGRLESTGGIGSFPAFVNATFQDSGYVHIATNLESSGTLTAAPYYIDGHRVALPDATITIQEGATFAIADYSTWTVQGNIIANGTAAAPILFTSVTGLSDSAQWRALRLTNAEGLGDGLPSSRLTHCVFEGGGDWYHAMLEVSGGAGVSLDQCVFRHSREDGIRFYDDSGGPISNTRFENNVSYGLWLRGSSPAVDGCNFVENGNVGRLESGADKGSFPAFTDTTFQDSGYVHIASNIASSGTLTAAPYFIDGHRVALPAATITIQGGATFNMANYSTWTVQGNVVADGTEAEPILFTSHSGVGEGAYWRALRLSNGEGDGEGRPSRISHCTFEGGGDWYGTMLESYGGAPVTIDHCVFRQSVVDGVRFFENSGGSISETLFESNAGYGLWLRGSSPAVDQCTFTGNGNASKLESGGGIASFPAFTNTTFEGDDRVHIATNIDSGGTLTAAPYFMDGHRVAAAEVTIKIDGGASFSMADYATWTVHGNVVAQGTEARPILFTSHSGVGEGANWRALRLSNNEGNGTGRPSELSYCTFEGGGDWYATLLEVYGGAPATLDHCTFRRSVVDGVRFADNSGGAITNCTFEDVAQYGLRVQSTSPPIANCTFQRCGTQAILLLTNPATADSFPIFSNNIFGPDDYIEIGGNIHTDGRFSNPGQAYFINGSKTILPNADVSFAPGTTVKFANYTALVIQGSLNASGTGEQPITFTSDDEDKARGQWRALSFTGERTKPSLLKHCTVEAGGEWIGTLVEVTGTPAVEIDQCTLRLGQGNGIEILSGTNVPVTLTSVSECSGHGIYVDNASPHIDACDLRQNGGGGFYVNAAEPLITNTWLRENANSGVWVARSPVPMVSQCFISGNGEFGIRNQTREDVIARDNWWGHPSGPQHPTSNPEGEGDAVTDYVVFEPYRVAATKVPQELQAILLNGEAVAGSFPRGVSGYYYAVDVPAGQNLTLSIDDANDEGVTQVYLSRSGFPTPTNYQVRQEAKGADQRLFVPAAGPGRWYALVYQFTPENSSNFTIRADMADIAIHEISPERHANTVPITMTITGAGFVGDTEVALIAGVQIIQATSVEVDSFTRLTATFPPNIPAGIFDVRVTVPGKTPAWRRHAFEGLEGGRPHLVTDLIVPAAVGYHQLATLYVEYANEGEVAMPAPLLIVTGFQNDQRRALLTLDRSRLIQGFWTSAIPEGFSNTVQILGSGETPGILQPGESGRIPVYYAGWQQPWDFAYPPIEFGLSTLEATDTRPIDWPTLKASLKTGGMDATAFDVIWQNYKIAIGSTVGEFVTMLGANAAYLARLGHTIQDVDALNQFEFLQAEGIAPLPHLDRAIDYSLQGAGMPLVFERFYPPNLSRRFRQGDLGRGWVHSWDIASSSLSDGTVVIRFRGQHRVFQPDARGGYFSAPHESGRLLNGGADADYILREGDGRSYHFKDGKFTYLEDRNGNRITASYVTNRISKLKHTSGAELNLTYDGSGRLTGITDQHQRKTTYGYNPQGTLSLVTNAYARSTAYAYHPSNAGSKAHALTSVQRPDETGRTFSYDGNGRLAATARSNGSERVNLGYDSHGSVSMTDALGSATRVSFDHRGLATRTTDGNGASRTQISGDRFNLMAEEDGTGANRSYQYDSSGRMVRVTGKSGADRELTYDRDDRLTSFADELGRKTDLGYDASGNVASVTHPDGTTRQYEHDANGNLNTLINGRGQRIAMTHDAAGRLTSKTYPDGSKATYTYDSRGRLASTTAPAGTTSYEYDANDRPKQVTYPEGTSLSYQYDSAGRRSTMTDHQGNVTRYEYDDAGRVSRVADTANATIVGYDYNAAGKVARKTLPDGSSVTYDYHSSGQVNSETRFDASGAVTESGTIHYDSDSRPVAIETSEGTRTYEWNANGQVLTQAFAPANGGTPETMTYEYDPVGHLARTTMNGYASEYTTDERGNYVSGGDTTFEHDADGNVTRLTTPAGSTDYQYDSENRLVSASSPNFEWSRTIDPTGLTTAIMEGQQDFPILNDPTSPVTFTGLLNEASSVVSEGIFGRDFTSLDRPLANSPLLQPNLIDRWEDSSFPLSPLGLPLPLTVDDIGSLADTALRHPLTHAAFNNPLTDIVTHSYTGLGVGGSGLGMGLLEIAKGSDYVNDLKWFGRTSTALTGLSYLSGTIETVQGLQNNDGYKVSHGVGSIGATALGGWIAGSGGVAVLGAAALPISVGLGAAVLALDYAGRDGGMMESFWIWWDDLDVTGDRLKTKPSQSMDPNEKLGPAGHGTANFVGPNETLAYRVDFENDKDAAAPAQVVMITDPLSDQLDWSTFELTEVGFGDHLIPVPGSSQTLNWVEPMTYLDKDLEVQIDVSLNPLSGVITAIFSSTDTESGLPPEVQYGFLPPEDETGRGQGYFNYTIRSHADLPTGTEIRNVATIIFDFGEVIDTNQVDPHDPSKGTDPDKEALVTIDADAPTSLVQSLSANSGPSFTVSWTGEDGTGAGIANYTVYVKDGSEDWEPWLENTDLTSSTFAGLNGHTYAFYALARDLVGNEESGKSVGEATTIVSGGADPYPGWLEAHFNEAEIAEGILTTRHADPDRDGTSNGEEFAFAMDPRSPDTIGLRAFSLGDHLAVEYRRRTTGVSYRLESSANLNTWQTETVTDESVLHTDDESEWARLVIPRTADNARYLRVRADN